MKCREMLSRLTFCCRWQVQSWLPHVGSTVAGYKDGAWEKLDVPQPLFHGVFRGYPHRWMVFREIPNLIAG